MGWHGEYSYWWVWAAVCISLTIVYSYSNQAGPLITSNTAKGSSVAGEKTNMPQDNEERPSALCKEIQHVDPKVNQSWIFIGRTDAEAETPVLWPPDAKNQLEKTLMLGKTQSRRGWQRMRRLDGITNSMDMNLSRLRELMMDREAQRAVVHGSQVVGHDWMTELNYVWLFATL